MTKGDGRTARRDASRQKLIDAAFRIFETQGAPGLTMRALAKEAGVAEATPYNVFETKDGVLNAMLAVCLQRAQAAAAEVATSAAQASALERLLRIVDSITQQWSEPSGTLRGIMRELKMAGPQVELESRRSTRAILLNLHILNDQGWITDEIPLEILAERIVLSNSGLFETWMGDTVTEQQLWAAHRLNILIPLLGVATESRRAEITSYIAHTIAFCRTTALAF